MSERRRLTDKQRRFVEEYCVDFNAAGAARRAGYSERCAKQIGYENLTKPYLREAIRERLSEFSMSAAEAQGRLSALARGNIWHFLQDDDGRIRIDLQSEEAQSHFHLLKKVKVRQKDGDTSVEIELHDAQAALVAIARAHGLFDPSAKGGGRVGVIVVPRGTR